MRTFYITPNFFKGLTKALLTLSLLLFFSPTIQAQSGDHATRCGASKSNAQEFVNFGGFTYEMWQSKKDSDGCMVVKSNKDFYASWTKIGNTLIRKSQRANPKNNQLIDYYVDSSFSGNSFYSCYGWWRDNGQSNSHRKIVEYYVVEGYGVHKPVDGLDYKGNYTVSGEGTYELWIGDDRNDPTVYGASNMDFTQIKAVRTSKRGSGKISMAKHFSEWAKEGFSVKNLYEVSFKIEGFSGGNFNQDRTQGGAYIRADFGTSGSFNSGGGSSSGGSSSSGTLSGNYRLKNKWAGYYATSDNKEQAIVKMTNKEDWSSQEWKLEHISGNEYRLREQYGKRYLRATSSNGGGVEVRDLRSSWNSQKWILEKSGSYYRLKSKWTGRYLRGNNQKWGNVTTHDDRNWASLKWELIPVSGSKSALATTETNSIEKEINTNKEISIYPNPSNSFINLSLSGYDSDEQTSVVIYDMQGRIVNEISNIQELITINTSDLSSGTYLMRISTGKEEKIMRFHNN